jgi:hypothetical protein
VFSLFGTATLTNCTLAGNTARGGDGSFGGSGYGGGVFNLDGSLTLTNCTVAGNTVTPGGLGTPGSADGDAVYNLAFGNTFAAGTAPPPGSAVTASLTLVNTILAGSSGALHDLVNQELDGPHANTATVAATAPNLVVTHLDSHGTLGTAQTTGTPLTANPHLGPLQNNGGPTPTRELLAGSPALNAGTTTGAPAADQRGLPRGTTISLGAYQATATRLLLTGFPAQHFGLSGSFTVTAVDAFGKTSFGYRGTVSFQASVPASLPPPSTLTNGSGSFSATFSLPGVVTLSASDGAIAGSEVVGVTGTLASRVLLKAVRVGKVFQLSAVVRGVPALVPTGRIVFYDLFRGQRRRLASAPLRGGRATLGTSLLRGIHQVLAVYGGNGVYAHSQGAVVVSA